MAEENWVPSHHQYHNVAIKGSVFNLGYGLYVYERSADKKTHPQFFVRNSSGYDSAGVTYYVPNDWGVNNWVHLVGTYSASANRIRLYEAGTNVADLSTTRSPGATSDNFYIARPADSYSYNDNFFKGYIADVRVYNRELTPGEVAEIYHKRGADRVWQGLVGWWRLDELPSGTLAEHTDVAPHNMTSNNSPSPYVASASSEYYYGNEAYRAFDGSNAVWGSIGTSGWLKLDYGSGNAPVLIGYAIKSYVDPDLQTVMPKNWTFKGSNNGSSWTTLDTRTNVTGWTASAWKEFWFSNSTGYRYYMIDITANNGYSWSTYIEEMKHFTSQYNVDLSGNGNHGTPHGGTYQASPHRLRRGVIVS